MVFRGGNGGVPLHSSAYLGNSNVAKVNSTSEFAEVIKTKNNLALVFAVV